MATLVELKAATEKVAAIQIKLANRRQKVSFLEGALLLAQGEVNALTLALDGPAVAALPVVNGEP